MLAPAPGAKNVHTPWRAALAFLLICSAGQILALDSTSHISQYGHSVRESFERSRAALDLEIAVRDLRNCYASLTPRERQVMALVVAGLLNRQVGGELGIGEITVKAHRGSSCKK